ncbi:conserved repeat domain protein [Fibrisoma limi BUZ 3]|uniref:Conserved repeat domain protein n=1 Tax=Fibrisoma limi BUZ 3 TaxID=1185876 RepID=I2GHX3_9BACT|nr:PQQ-dependent sugar dehydrogenase [Fibrisoma limi]CCH53498.1 conserved repeat domain protein [Fibrisoma limi BUZ 3]
MLYYWLNCLLLTLSLVNTVQAQLPRSLHPNITVEKLMATQVRGVRVAYDAQTRKLYYHSFPGDVYRIEQPANGQPYEVPIASAADHGINYLQGMAFANGVVVLVGNFKETGQRGYGLVVKGISQPNGTWRWERIMQTAPYPSSATLYDHAFNAVCVTPRGDSVYVNSGSRTDHGEVEDTGGLYPDTREVPLTATIFKLPINPPTTILLPNDQAALDQSGYVFCRGVRNEFDLALDQQGRLFGVENSGDRDDPEEMNWLRPGRHYGFPWEMGGNQTPQQFPGYIPSQDKLLPATLSPDQQQKFYNDPAFPPKPGNLVITQPIRSLGPDASFVRDPATGQVQRVNSIATFTSHRSPLGLIFDTDNALADFTGDAFVLSYSAGGGIRGGYLFAEDPGEDLLHVRLQYDPAADNFTAQTTKVVDGFIAPTDAERVGNVMYVIEEGRQCIWKLTFRPYDATAKADLSLSIQSSDRVVAVNRPVSVTVTIRNDGPSEARNVQLENRLPSFLAYTGGDLTNDGGVLKATVPSIATGEQAGLVYQVTAQQPGTFRNAAQITTTTTPDPDSQAGSGTADGEDDAALLTLRTLDAGPAVYESPNPTQRPLPVPASNQPAADPTKSDVSIQLAASTLIPRVNNLVSITVVVTNRGGLSTTAITVQYTLPSQMVFVSGGGWTPTGTVLTGQLTTIPVGGTAFLTFQARVTASGRLLNQAQVSAADPLDPDSTPGNGLATGEDDTARLELRAQ